ncbi:MAG: cysteine--tRNA ligase, partial [Candidatus Omnitrophota bacterium]|nr:cysteine--tRNA ligase [Candidatus Omnitrophota bacterium]
AFGEVLGIKFYRQTPSEGISYLVVKKINEREEARRNRNYKLADDIRKELENQGVVIEDTKHGPKWRLK